MSAAQTPRALTHRETQVVLMGLLSTLVLTAMDQTTIATVLPAIAVEFGGLSDVTLAVTFYLLTCTASIPLFGKASDFVQHRPLLMLAVAIFVCGAVASGTATSVEQLVLARSMQGIGAGGVTSMTQVIVASLISPRQRGRYLGYFTVVFVVASAVGPLVGGLLVATLSWRWVFLGVVPLGVLALALTRRLVPPSRPGPRHAVDVVGALLLTGGVAAAVLMTSWGGTRLAWTSPPLLALAAAALALPALLALHERRAPDPIVPAAVVREPVLRITTLASLILGVLLFSSIYLVPAIFQIVRDSSATASGLMLLPLMSGIIVTTIYSGRRVTATGRYKRFIIAGMALVAAGLATLSTVTPSSPGFMPYLATTILGLGFGMAIQLLVLAAQNAAPPGQTGATVGMVTLARLLGGAVGTAVFGTVVAWRARAHLSDVPATIDDAALRGSRAAIDALPPALRDDLLDAFTAAAGQTVRAAVPLALLGVALVALLRERPLRGSPPAEAPPA